MKLVYLTPDLGKTGGPNRVLMNIISHYPTTSNADIDVICLKRRENNGTYEDDINGPNIKIHYLEDLGYPKLISIIRLRGLVKSLNPDIVHSNSFKTDILQLLVPRKIFKTSTAHNVPYEDFVMAYGRMTGLAMTIVQVALYKTFDGAISVSNRIAEYFGMFGITTKTIHNGVPINATILKTKQNNERPIFIWTGRLIERKNLTHTLELFFKNPDIGDLYVVGEGPLLGEYIKLFSSAKNITFVGHTDDVQKYLSFADVFISPSLSEGLPMASLEALASGLPLILSDIPSHREIFDVVGNTNVVKLFPLNNSDAEKVVISDFKIRKKDSDLALKAHKTYFSAETMADKYKKFFSGFLDANIE
ncbi:glycosyltransferase family 4 protein [Weissella cibaria]|uniref:EpsF_1 protein n=1 Tax=Weissella cibaria TaxID=137591 RepID=A0A0D1M7G7_9LACO|nr:glycosyltransferase family 4 protein [Weissella cibaria]KIU20416.1 putative glycosyltransferase EpsF [Weissella cibaria]KIU24011.1 putative glycosyltransferase EpsF [Weissella cibaria]MDV8930782.1 glycosyltransferase family 4 protein [Weissella cibaria]